MSAVSPASPNAPPWAAVPSQARTIRHRGRAWSQEVEVDAAGFRARLNAVKARLAARGGLDPEDEEIAHGVEDLLNRAVMAARGEYPRHHMFISWWRGTCIEAAFQNVHQAESELVLLYNVDEVEAEVPHAVARTEVALNRDDPYGKRPGR